MSPSALHMSGLYRQDPHVRCDWVRTLPNAPLPWYVQYGRISEVK